MYDARPKLIKAVVDCIEGKSPPPWELDILWQCEKFHSLPTIGGILDQPYNLMLNIKIASNVYIAWSEWKNVQPENKGEWIKNNPSLYAICNQILKDKTNG